MKPRLRLGGIAATNCCSSRKARGIPHGKRQSRNEPRYLVKPHASECGADLDTPDEDFKLHRLNLIQVPIFSDCAFLNRYSAHAMSSTARPSDLNKVISSFEVRPCF